MSEHHDTNRIGASTMPMGDVDRPRRDRHCLAVWVDGVPTRWPLPARGDVIIGRDQTADIRVDSRAVSRRHARLSVDGFQVRISDLESRNSTRVNGQLVSGEQALAYGDLVALGDVVAVLEGVPALGERVAGEPLPGEQHPGEGLELAVGARKLFVAEPLMGHVFTQLRRLAESQLAVLVVGETGTGKDLAAEAIHAWSSRAHHPFVTVNCAALPEALAESELFGHERGAFSGATSDKPGLFESAGGGTLFLDEIGELPRSVQPKLLRVLESRRVTRLGAVRERAIDVRIVTATNRDLANEVRAGRFRQDLYYRLGAAVVQLPPLHRRPLEIPLLARRFFAQARADLRAPPVTLSSGALARLAEHRWPGNVRELKNLMEYLAALSDADVSADDVTAALARDVSSPPSTLEGDPTPAPVDLRAAKQDLERRSIEAALQATGGNKTRAARLLKMPLRTLMWKLKRAALTDERAGDKSDD